MFDKFLDLNHPFFLPVWRRYATIASCALWMLFELVFGTPFWAVLAGALAAYTAWSFLLKFDEAAARARRDGDKDA